MKRMKRIMALMLAAIMMMAMSVTAFAAEGATGTHTLTVNAKGGQDLKGQTINLYKLFDVTESGTTESKNYAYTVNTAAGYKDALVSVLGSSITASSTDEQFAAAVLAIGSNDSTEVQKFANDFTTYALKNSLAATATSSKITESQTSYDFTGLDAGYYLVYVTGGKEIQSSLGDIFYIKVLDETLAYQIDQILTVLPEETDGLSIEPGKDYATLVTCTPFAINTHRLLVRGERIPYEEATKQEPDTNIKPELSFTAKVLIVTIIVIFIGLMIAVIYSIRDRKRRKVR